MNDLEYERTIEQLGDLREHLRQLEDVDYMTATYKGYSSSGLTLDEITDQMTDINESIHILEEKLENDAEQY
ncbi:hypothetical protein LOOC260_112640 [Paucilactobacillus hokkaidonensis JCM 18461]|uniref:Uncharacterized protein n=2 Tax=Paucilactobacillus hokkaidonensis TaxID=1193095 RepID=A0A0A1GU60_9LACO|nr:hypothetical protein [Paucilactobacillus hokkaidonensis]KRO10348.1 hypothetical protein IV59_GL001966 [Paucilactobacillus hokkaidonensis]BAP85802.1 hypothetical protein LOOC260_112640 [Paucilactobacillus hokkaidonensis JCM 18461]